MPSIDLKIPNVEIKYTKIFINNEWHQAENGKTFSVINPSTGEEICQVEEASRVRICAHMYFLNTSLFFFDRLMSIKPLKQLVKLLILNHLGVN
jgi:hypothetical protein